METGFFEEAPGVFSMIRLMSFILLMFFIVVNVIIIFKYGISTTLTAFDSALLLFVFAPKAAQKYFERHGNSG